MSSVHGNSHIRRQNTRSDSLSRIYFISYRSVKVGNSADGADSRNAAEQLSLGKTGNKLLAEASHKSV